MNDSLDTQAAKFLSIFVPAGEDRFGYFKTLGISSVAFKVTAQEREAQPNMFIYTRMSGSTSWKASLSSKSGRNGST